MPHAFSLPRISTNVRFAASHLLFPELAGAWAERMFLTPPRGRDAAIENQHRGNAITQKAVRLAIEEGHLMPGTEPEQISFEMLGIVLASHNHRRLLGDKEARKRALKAFDQLISRYATTALTRAHTAAR